MEYFFKMLTNIKVESSYLHKTNCVVSGLYREGSLVGGLLPMGTQLDLLEYLYTIYSLSRKATFLYITVSTLLLLMPMMVGENS